MRHHLEILEELEKLLSDKGFNNELLQLKSEIAGSFTGTELCLRCGSKLLTLKRSNRMFSSVASDLITEFISYCHQNGLFPKPIYEA